ncbi:MAG: hypothetical protein KatS3mg112_1625 [Thermogutta sp.]|nr:MAG: hypothetical protein KatS3mg112_1625 [Thermogutta sp.]
MTRPHEKPIPFLSPGPSTPHVPLSSSSMGTTTQSPGVYEHWLEVDLENRRITYGRNPPRSQSGTKYRVTINLFRDGRQILPRPVSMPVEPGSSFPLPDVFNWQWGDELEAALYESKAEADHSAQPVGTPAYEGPSSLVHRSHLGEHWGWAASASTKGRRCGSMEWPSSIGCFPPLSWKRSLSRISPHRHRMVGAFLFKWSPPSRPQMIPAPQPGWLKRFEESLPRSDTAENAFDRCAVESVSAPKRDKVNSTW